MDGRYDRNPEVLDQGQSVTQALVVMEDVESFSTLQSSQSVVSSQAESERFREGTCERRSDFIEIEGLQHAKRSLGKVPGPTVDVEALQFDDFDLVDNMRMRRTGEDLNFMPKPAE